MSIITPLLLVVPWLKKTLPPHSADHTSALSFELCVNFLKKCEVYLLVVDPSKNGPTFYRLLEASGVDGQALNVKGFQLCLH